MGAKKRKFFGAFWLTTVTFLHTVSDASPRPLRSTERMPRVRKGQQNSGSASLVGQSGADQCRIGAGWKRPWPSTSKKKPLAPSSRNSACPVSRKLSKLNSPKPGQPPPPEPFDILTISPELRAIYSSVQRGIIDAASRPSLRQGVRDSGLGRWSAQHAPMSASSSRIANLSH